MANLDSMQFKNFILDIFFQYMYIEVVNFEIKGQYSPLLLDAWSFNAFLFIFWFIVLNMKTNSTQIKHLTRLSRNFSKIVIFFFFISIFRILHPPLLEKSPWSLPLSHLPWIPSRSRRWLLEWRYVSMSETRVIWNFCKSWITTSSPLLTRSQELF